MRDPFHKALELSRQSEPYVDDLRRLLVFHGLDNGAPLSSAAVLAKLADSNAFRGDLAALAQHISDLEHRTVSDDEMLERITVAAGQRELVQGFDDPPPVPASTLPRTPPIANGTAYGVAKSESVSFAHANEAASASDSEASASTPTANASHSLPDPQLPSANTQIEPQTGTTTTGSASSQGRLELAVAELKVYLDDIDRRIGRLEPRLEDITRIIQTSAQRSEQPHSAEAELPRPKTPSASDPLSSPLAPLLPTPAIDQIHTDPANPATSAPNLALPIARNAPARVSDATLLHQSLLKEHSVFAEPNRQDLIESPAADTGNKLNHKSARETAGRLLAVAAVLLAIVGCIVAVFALRNPDASLTTAKTSIEPKETPDQISSQPAPAVAIPRTTQSGTPSLSPRSGITAPQQKQRARSSSSKAAVHQTETNPTNTEAVPARVAGKRSQPTRREPQIEDLAPSPPISRTPAGAAMANAQPAPPLTGANTLRRPELTSPSAVHNGGTPLVESHSSLDSALIASKKPVYPQEALRQHKEGTVVLNATIARDGTVRRMDVVEGSPGFTRSALDAVSWWRYKPQHTRGEAAEAQAKITLDYRLR